MQPRLSFPALAAAVMLGATALSGLTAPACATPSNVFINLHESGFTDHEFSGVDDAFASSNYSFGTYNKFKELTASYLAAPNDLSFSDFRLSTTNAPKVQTLTITVSVLDITNPHSLAKFTLGIDKNGVVSNGWKVDVAVYLDTSDTKYKTTGTGVTLLDPPAPGVEFTNPGASSFNDSMIIDPGPKYAITTVYKLNIAKGSGAAGASADIAALAVPEPASLALLGTALAGLLLTRTHRCIRNSA